jgi:hypothetical protein
MTRDRVEKSTERKMKMFLMVGLACAGFVSASFIDLSRAQTGFAPPSSLPEQQAGPADNQIANDVDARIATLKAGLQLTVEQEKNWPALQSQLHDYEIQQLEIAVAESASDEKRRRWPTSETDRLNELLLLRKLADGLAAKAAALKKLADAAEPFYTSLDPRQKDELFRLLGPEFDFRRS